MSEGLSPGQSVLLQLWRDHYPILYWANRINKINPLNEHDEMEAVFTLLQLSDTYVTNLVAMLRNPKSPWYYVKERTYKQHIDETLGLFESPDGSKVDLHNYNNELENVVSFTPFEGWDVSPTEVFVKDLLGCPHRINEEEEELIFDENPDDYIEVCNGVVNFRQRYIHLLNDLKHGFRLLPFKWESIEDVEEHYLEEEAGIDLDEKKEEYENTKDDYIYFWRLEGDADEEVDKDQFGPGEYYPTGVALNVYRIEIGVCTQLSRAILVLLHNLIGTDPVKAVEGMEPLVDESGELTTFELFLPSYLVGKA